MNRLLNDFFLKSNPILFNYLLNNFKNCLQYPCGSCELQKAKLNYTHCNLCFEVYTKKRLGQSWAFQNYFYIFAIHTKFQRSIFILLRNLYSWIFIYIPNFDHYSDLLSSKNNIWYHFSFLGFTDTLQKGVDYSKCVTACNEATPSKPTEIASCILKCGAFSCQANIFFTIALFLMYYFLN